MHDMPELKSKLVTEKLIASEIVKKKCNSDSSIGIVHNSVNVE